VSIRKTITAIIPSFNEEDHILQAIASVSWCDQVMVVDSFSTDRTAELVKSTSAQLIQHEYEGPAHQKNWSIQHAEHDWIIFLDADERVTDSLRKEMEKVLIAPAFEAYWICRQNHFMGKQIRYSGWQNDKVIRLFKKGSCTYAPVAVHEEMQCRSEVGLLQEKLLHYTYKDLNHYLEKFDRYTTWSARDRALKTGDVGYFHLLGKPVFRFFRHFVIKLGFLDGKEGFIISVLSGYSVFLRYLKLLRIQKGEKL
jgi:glycosyltransferase involved in cell wall biosynthesis